MMFVGCNKILSRIKESFKTTAEPMVNKSFSVKNALPFGLKALKTFLMQRSNYWRRVVGTESEGLFRAVVHTNAYNI